MATKLLDRFPNVYRFTWKYTESGYGKSAKDDIGACKRTADTIRTAGGDIENPVKLVEVIEKRCLAIILRIVQDTYVHQISAKIEREAAKLKSFNSTHKVHQVIFQLVFN